MRRALKRNRGERKNLMDFIRWATAQIGEKAKGPKKDRKIMSGIIASASTVNSVITGLNERSPQQQVMQAQCSFDVLRAIGSLAFTVANLKDAAVTCEGEHMSSMTDMN